MEPKYLDQDCNHSKHSVHVFTFVLVPPPLFLLLLPVVLVVLLAMASSLLLLRFFFRGIRSTIPSGVADSFFIVCYVQR